MTDLDISPELVTRTLVHFIRSRTGESGLTKVVIGLSGGVDSSTCAYLAVRALGPENVRALLMPYGAASDMADARIVVAGLGVAATEIDIAPMVDAYAQMSPNMDRIRKGNLMARQRMIVLYDQSRLFNALVLGTGNRTEYLLGYTTLWGDMACAFTPIGCLYKTQVRQLAAYLGVPKRIIEKAPTAGLWPGQTDEGEIGITYADADRLLYHMVDLKRTADELEQLGFQAALISRARHMIRTSRHKRRMPLSPTVPALRR